jgi:hypothetical protein
MTNLHAATCRRLEREPRSDRDPASRSDRTRALAHATGGGKFLACFRLYDRRVGQLRRAARAERLRRIS